jgi:phage gp46-like protein
MQDTKHIMDENGLYVIALKGSDIAVVDGLETAMQVSLFTNARMDESVRSNPLQRGGWAGNIQNAKRKRQLGGHCWTLEDKNITTYYLAQAKEKALRAHDWMLIDKLARNVSTTASKKGDDVAIGVLYIGRDGKQYDTIYLWKKTHAFTNAPNFNT